MIEITNLHAQVEGKQILNGLSLKINPGEVHAIMGPNGSGKSTLSSVLAGKDDYQVTQGSVQFFDNDLLEMEVEDRANAGLMLAFQYPVEIPGVKNVYLLRTALNAKRKAQGLEELDAPSFMRLIREKLKFMQMDTSFLHRAVNEGFSGGEKKRNEILQMLVLEPKLVLLDEIDSGLDIDALKLVAQGVNSLRSPERSFLMITHYQRLLDYIEPDFVHVLYNGQIIKTGNKNLALELEERGYDWVIAEQTKGA